MIECIYVYMCIVQSLDLCVADLWVALFSCALTAPNHICDFLNKVHSHFQSCACLCCSFLHGVYILAVSQSAGGQAVPEVLAWGMHSGLQLPYIVMSL